MCVSKSANIPPATIADNCPFVGLRPFGTEDSLYFFGRREQTAELLERLHATHFLAVVGSSGCGKSSLIRAGLIPALLGGFLVEERDKWRIAVMKPGDTPLRNLAEALCQACNNDDERDTAEHLQAAILESHSQAIVDFINHQLGEDTNLLLLIDQFEEIFAFRGSDPDAVYGVLPREERREITRRRKEAANFVDLILKLRQVTCLHTYTVMTMRTDFLGDCDLFYGLPEAMYRSLYLVPRLTRSQLRQAIEGPALLFGVQFAPRLLDQLLNELGDRSDRLPILQHALLRTWQMWRQDSKNCPLDFKHYEAAGTLDNALSQHAEEALQDEDREATAKIFKCLTGVDPNHRKIRRPSHISELSETTQLSPETVQVILQRFQVGGRHFVTISPGTSANDSRIDITHESLIRQWGTLQDWVDEEEESRDQFIELVRGARENRALLQDPDLQKAIDWRQSSRPIAAWARRYSSEAGDYDAAMYYLNCSESEEQRQVLDDRVKSSSRFFYVVALASFIGGIFERNLFSLAIPIAIMGEETDWMSAGIVVVMFTYIGISAEKGNLFAFLVGMSLYVLDLAALIFCLRMDWDVKLPLFVFHVFVLYYLIDGLRACIALRRLGQALEAPL